MVSALALLPWAVSRWMEAGTQVLMMLFLSGGAYLVCVLRSKAPRTWAEALDARLAEYNPFSREALIGLQAHLKAVGYLDGDIVRSWLDSEAERCADAVKLVYGAPASQFLQRQL